MERLINLPKADVHLHFESLFDIEILYDIAKRNSITPSILKQNYYEKRENFSCLFDLFELLDVNFDIPTSSQDIYDLTSTFYKKISTKNIVYIEPAICFTVFNKISAEHILKGFLQASSEAESLYNIKTNIILQLARGSSIESQTDLLHSLQPYKHHFAGIGLAGNEFSKPSKHFAGLYDLARNLGYCNEHTCTAHSGEECPPEYIIETLHYLKVNRLDHAIRAREDPFLLNFLGKNHFPIAMCPVSNQKLKINERFCEGKYCYDEFIDKGCMVSINSDDPEIYNSFLDDVYRQFLENYENTQIFDNFAQIVKNGFLMGFLQENEKKYFLSEIDSQISKIN